MSELPEGWTRCEDCGDATPEVDAEEGVCITCWEGRAFKINAERSLHVGAVYGCRECAWYTGTKAVEARREARRIIHAMATASYWQLTGPHLTRAPLIFDELHIWPKGAVLDAKISELQALRDIAKQGELRALRDIAKQFPSTFTRQRSWGRRALEWAARWFGYYIR